MRSRGPAATSRGRTALVLVAVLAGLSCAPPPDPVDRDVQSVKDRSVPARGRLVPGDARRDGNGLRVTWEIECDMPWAEYAPWLEARLGEFRVRNRETEVLQLSRVLEGDFYVLSAMPSRGAGAQARVRLAFDARPF